MAAGGVQSESGPSSWLLRIGVDRSPWHGIMCLSNIWRAEGGRGLGHRLPLLPDPAEHLALDLDQVMGIEERMARVEGCVCHRLGPGVESAVATQGRGLVLSTGRHSRGRSPE